MSNDGDMKAALRTRMLDVLSRVDATDVARQSALVVARVLEHEWYIGAGSVAVYVSMANEIDTEPIIRHALASGVCECAVGVFSATGKQVFVPRFTRPKHPMRMLSLHSVGTHQLLSAEGGRHTFIRLFTNRYGQCQ